jgi:hypothetical protein
MAGMVDTEEEVVVVGMEIRTVVRVVTVAGVAVVVVVVEHTQMHRMAAMVEMAAGVVVAAAAGCYLGKREMAVLGAVVVAVVRRAQMLKIQGMAVLEQVAAAVV